MEAIASRLLAAAPTWFALAGLSMGGYVALEVLRQARERVTRLALLQYERPSRHGGRARTPPRPDRGCGGRAIRGGPGGALAASHPPHRLHYRALEAIVRGMMRESGVETFVRQQRAIMGRRDSRALLGAIEVPTLVLVGAQDALTPPEIPRQMADGIEGASLVVAPQSGHLSTLERPEAVTRALQAWLSLDRTGGRRRRRGVKDGVALRRGRAWRRSPLGRTSLWLRDRSWRRMGRRPPQDARERRGQALRTQAKRSRRWREPQPPRARSDRAPEQGRAAFAPEKSENRSDPVRNGPAPSRPERIIEHHGRSFG